MKFLPQFLLKKKFLLILIGGIILAAGYFYFKNKDEENQEIKYQITQLAKGNLEVKITGSGQIYAESQVDLKATVAGDGLEVAEVNIKNNDAVKKDQVIAVLDTSDADKAIKDAQYDLKTAKLQLQLTEEQSSKQTVEDTLTRRKQEVAVKQKQLALNKAYEKLEDYSIKAPFDGVITNFELEPGDSVSTEDTVGSVITNEKYALITLNEVDASKISIGSKVTLTFDALEDLTLEGEVEKLDSIGTVEQGVVSYNAKIKLDEQDERLKIGMSVNAEIVIESKDNILTVTNTAIQSSERGNFVLTAIIPAQKSYAEIGQGGRGSMKMVNKDEIEIQRTPVELGITDDIKTEITSGLNEGDIIVIQELNLNPNSSTENNQGNGSGNSSILPTGGPGGGGSRGR